jgi:hypothetical protein
MNTQHNLKEPYFQANTPLLDKDFDLFSPEVIDFISSQKSSKEDPPYMMSFMAHSKKRPQW